MHILVAFTLLQTVAIGSELRDGLKLVYTSGGVEQTPWVYDSVRVVERPDFARCVLVARVAQPVRETCARGDTLFERRAEAYVPIRPIGSNAEFVATTATGTMMHYLTGEVMPRRLRTGLEVSIVPTTLVITDSTGTIVRRLRER